MGNLERTFYSKLKSDGNFEVKIAPSSVRIYLGLASPAGYILQASEFVLSIAFSTRIPFQGLANGSKAKAHFRAR